MKRVAFTKLFHTMLITMAILILFGWMPAMQGCGSGGGDSGQSGNIDQVNSSGTQNSQGDDSSSPITDYKAKAYEQAEKLYAAASIPEVETTLREILAIIAVPVFDHTDTAVVAGSGSLTDGVSLRDYHVHILADVFFRYIQHPRRYMTMTEYATGVQNQGGEYVQKNYGGQTITVPFDEGMVYYVATLYQTISQSSGSIRQYYLADLFTALSDQDPARGGLHSDFYLDPLQVFLMTLDWMTQPLNPAPFTGALTTAAAASSGAAPRTGMDDAKGYWGIAQFLAGAVSDALGNALNVASLIQGQILMDGTEIAIEGDSVIYYGTGTHTFTISVVFSVDLSGFAQDYGWTIGVDVPAVGPIKGAKVALDGWEALAPTHGLFSDGDLKALNGLAAGGAIADDNGQVWLNFDVKDQPGPTDPCYTTNEIVDPIELRAEVNPSTDPLGWLPGIVNTIFPHSMPYDFEVRWKEYHTEYCQ